MPDSPVQRSGNGQFGIHDPRVFRDPTLSTTVKAVYGYLAGFCGTSRAAFPSRSRIARELGISVRTFDAANRDAQAAGLWTTQRMPLPEGAEGKDRHRQPNIYVLHDMAGPWTPGDATASSRGKNCTGDPVQNLHGGGADSAPYQYQLPGPPKNTRTTSPDEQDSRLMRCSRTVTAEGGDGDAPQDQEQTEPTDGPASWPVLCRPSGMGELYQEDLIKKLTATMARAWQRCEGKTAPSETRRNVGLWVQYRLSEHPPIELDVLWDEFRVVVDQAWNDHATKIYGPGRVEPPARARENLRRVVVPLPA